ncbi:MAG: hypothetical protein LUB62_01240 [Prevotellaceae bacterium]|nr:hypothetical protein [Prevotellaceae bacterium]
MKHRLLILFCTLCACASVFGMGRKGVYSFFSPSESYHYEDDNVMVVIYGMQLVVYNKTDQVIYLDKQLSYAYLNSAPTCLFTNATYTNTTSASQGASVNLGAVARGMGVKGGLGSMLNGVNVGGGVTQGSATTYYEQRIATIAPKSAYVAYNWANCKSLLKRLNVISGKYIYPTTSAKTKLKKGLSWHFSDSTSPINLRGVICYSEDENFSNPTQITVSNYLSEIVVGSYKGINASPQCEPYKDQDYQKFNVGSSKGLVFGCAIGIPVYVAVLCWALATTAS